MSEPALSIEDRIELVKAAIQRVHRARANKVQVHMDPYSSHTQRLDASDYEKSAEREFGWQYLNVEEIFKAKGI